MTPRTLRSRLMAAAVLAVAVAVAFLGVTAHLLVAHQLRSSLDRSLRQRATDVARLSVSAPAVISSPGALEGLASGRQLSVEVLDRRGRFVARSLALGAKLLPETAAARIALASGRPGFADATLGGEPLRLYAAPLPTDAGPVAGGAVLVASSTSDIDDTLRRLRLLLALCGLLAAVIGGAAAAALTRRSLGPLGRLSCAAAEIERSGDSARRLPEPASGDEVSELARTLNRMLAALDASRQRERRFLADASHELRTPLTSLAGNVDSWPATAPTRRCWATCSSTAAVSSASSTTCSRWSARTPRRLPGNRCAWITSSPRRSPAARAPALRPASRSRSWASPRRCAGRWTTCSTTPRSTVRRRARSSLPSAWSTARRCSR